MQKVLLTLFYLFVHPFLPSSLTVLDGAVCLCKFHCDLTNSLKFNMQAILQRGRILVRFSSAKMIGKSLSGDSPAGI